MEGVSRIVYKPEIPEHFTNHGYTIEFDISVRTGLAVAEACRTLKQQGVTPDIIVGHNGWGETLFVKDVFPNAPVLAYFEFFYHYQGVDVGFDPEYPPMPGDDSRLRVRNAVNHIGFDAADWGHTATSWQRSLYPAQMQPRIIPIHEGVNVLRAKPDPDAWMQLARGGLRLTRQDEVITYVSRNLEPYRGFHVFMRALPELMRRRPNAHFILIGGDKVSYGRRPPVGVNYREMMLEEVGRSLDLSRVHFLGQIAHQAYVNVLQVSSAHVYLTYPFVLSWSMIEAMACGCLVIGSATPPVMEVIRDRDNGLLVDFFSTGQLCDRIDEVLDHPDRMQDIRDRARQTAVGQFDLLRMLPRWLQLIQDVIDRRQPLTFPAAFVA